MGKGLLPPPGVLRERIEEVVVTVLLVVLALIPPPIHFKGPHRRLEELRSKRLL
jgi:hypothetical protein